MAIPHTVQKQLIKKRLRGLEGKAKINEIHQLLEELPNWNTGPYGELRKWLSSEIDKTKTRSNIKHQDFFGVKREGHRQFMLVGQPSVGKSSLIKRLCGLQTKVAAYAFTTLKPIPGVVRINGADMQLVDLPGLIEGASEDSGGGKRLLGLVKQTDGIILMCDATKPLDEVNEIVSELEKSKIDKPLIVVLNKVDAVKNSEEQIKRLELEFPQAPVIAVSTETGVGLEEVQQTIWKESRLIRTFPKDTQEPVILEQGSTVKDFAGKIHTAMAAKVKFARVTGTSAKFANQQVGLDHILEDRDEVELVLKR